MRSTEGYPHCDARVITLSRGAGASIGIDSTAVGTSTIEILIVRSAIHFRARVEACGIMAATRCRCGSGHRMRSIMHHAGQSSGMLPASPGKVHRARLRRIADIRF